MHDATVDPREVAHYERLANTWWDPSGPFWPLHRLNALRVDYIREHLVRHFGRDAAADAPLRGLRVLDVGCGGGILAESVAGLGAEVTAIDVVEKNIRVARRHARERQLDIDYRVSTVEALAGAGAAFDVVLNMEVVEHVADLDAFMHACNRVTRPGGAMFVATINRTPLAWLFAIVGAEYVLGWLPRGTHRWRWFRRPRELARLLAADGLGVGRITGVSVNPFTRRFRLRNGLAVNYMLMAIRKDGPVR